MLRKFKYFLLSFIFLISSFLPCISVYAQGSSWTAQEKIRYVGNAFYKIFTDISGVLVPSGLNGQDLQRDFQAYVLNSDVIQDNMSYDDWIASEIGITYQNGDSGNADIVYSPTFQNQINNFAHDYVQNYEPYEYVYSFQASLLIDRFANQEDYNNYLQFVREHDDNFLFYAGSNFNGSVQQQYISIYELQINDFQLLKGTSSNANYPLANIYKNWSYIHNSDLKAYRYSFVEHSWSESTIYNPDNNFSDGITFLAYPSTSSTTFYVTYKNAIDLNSTQYQVFKTRDGMVNSSQGVQSYYVTDSYNSNWVDNSITDSYNTTTTAVNNTISYEDVANYVNNYYVENNSYPTTNTVYNYINNYVPPENGGNGSDNGGGSSNIFDFLGTIGDFLGNLIEGIGNVLSGILSAITDVIDMFIGENGLPNVIGQLISYFLPFLPEWIPTVIGLSVMLALLIGIVKLIRGS